MAIESAKTKTSTWRRYVKKKIEVTETGFITDYIASVAVGGTTFTIPEVEVVIHDHELHCECHFPGSSDVTVSDLTEISTYVYIDRDNALQQQTTEPTRSEWATKAFLIRIAVDTSSNTIINFEYYNNSVTHIVSSVRDVVDYLKLAGIAFRKGLDVTGRVGDLGFDMAAGSALQFGGTGDTHEPNTINFDAVSNVEYFKVTRTESDAGGNTDLTKFWDNNGTLTAIGSTTWVGHRVYFFSSGGVAIQYGQGNYANINLAKAGVRVEEYVTNPAMYDGTLLGWWFIESTATATSGTPDAEFVPYFIGIR